VGEFLLLRAFPLSLGRKLVKILTTSEEGFSVEAFTAGTLAGAGSFRCETCGFAVALHELDEVPACPQCGGRKFKRASMFMAQNEPASPDTAEHDSVLPPTGPPEWLAEAREALVTNGDYVAFERDERVNVMPLQDGWTRIGRSLSAHIRFDDPTVSRRHALVHSDRTGARVLDDRSLNGVFLNGERVDWHELDDGDEIGIGAFHVYFLRVQDRTRASASGFKLAQGA
jgi:predicted  nucleic acid-binding Zn-ribbon protein